MTRKKIPAFAAFVIVTVMAISLFAEKKFAYTVHGIRFETSVEFSSPSKAGVDALLMAYPKNSNPENEMMSIIAVFYSRHSQKLMGMGDSGLLNYTKSVFLGLSGPGKPAERTFAGKKTKGELLDKKIPSPSTVEVYVITLSNGDKIGIGFNYSPQMKAEDAQKVIIEIGATMKE